MSLNGTVQRRWWGRLRRGFVLVGLGLLVFLLVLVIRALGLSSLQPDSVPPEPLAFDEKRAVNRLSGAIRFPTVSWQPPRPRDDAVFADFRAYLAESYPKLRPVVQREEINGSLLYTWPGLEPDLPPIVLAAHFDVVPAQPTAWRFPPFSGAVEQGAVWGRGTLDHKAAVTAILESVEALIVSGYQPRRTVYLAFGHDEELGGEEGAAYLAATIRQRTPHLAYLLDEGGMNVLGAVPGVASPVAYIGIAHKGYATVRLSVRATGGHSSMPPKETAIGILARAVTRLETHPFPAELDGAGRLMFEYLAPEMTFAPRLLFANLWLFEPMVKRILAAKPASNAVLRTTTAPTMFHAGTKANVLADRAEAMVNFRLLPRHDFDDVMDHVQRVVDDPRVSVELLGEHSTPPAPVSDVSAPEFGQVLASVRSVFPDAVGVPFLLMATIDAHHYEALTPNIYRYFPARVHNDDLVQVHGVDERIGVDNYLDVIRFYAELIRRTAS